jgi:aspartate dehydrogenase
MLKTGIVGMGVIGHRVAEALTRGIPGAVLVGVSVRNATTAGGYPVLPLPTLIERADLVVEAATQASLRNGPAVLAAASTSWCSRSGPGGRAGQWAGSPKHGRILVPSGAIAGLDGEKGAREGTITAVTMETRKPPRGLAGAPYIEQHRIDLDAITTETLIFEGPATDAVKAFPANVNVVAALSLAGIGPDRTRIKLYAVPGQARNQHRITVEGEFGTLRIEVENVPSENPRTGRLSTCPRSRCCGLAPHPGEPTRGGTRPPLRAPVSPARRRQCSWSGGLWRQRSASGAAAMHPEPAAVTACGR